ncbi:hypothetical protein DWF00_09705 [Bosea caraganae]|uniref:Uncharacterized protein n=1 Tax=Bosea caraganae TaxID=2763117 RepID=A0A370LBD7_9HYPH|nr:hypothetical protein [Bosea caraganae]RDJ27250.1 hypothetical protein DWF00_09705 [Bosea caraganae]RDJ29266.1 hypothetical protein DWE98_01475 [Bosea caraganae]
MTSRRRARHLLPAIALVAGTTLASACGFEDPKGADAARGALNWVYPESLHVTSAVWRAQLEGTILRDERPEAARALLGYRKAAADLARLRDRLVVAMDGESMPSFSILLIGPMLWTRFAPAQGGVSMVTHVDGPQTSDTVVVTDEPVVAALASGWITPLAARQKGLLRLYGPLEGQGRISARLDRLPAPLTAMARPR